MVRMDLSRYTTEEIRDELARRRARRVNQPRARLLLTSDEDLEREVKEREARNAGGYVGEGQVAAEEGKKSKRSVGVSRGDGRYACYG